MFDFKFKKEHLFLALLFCGILIPSFWQSLYSLPIIVVIGFFLIKDKTNTYKLTLLDIGIILLFLSEFITTVFSSYSFNSLSSITRMTLILFSYLLYKKYANKGNYYYLFLLFFFIFSLVLVILTAGFFKEFAISICDNGFRNLNDFKNLYSPIGRLNNSWGTVLLLMLPFNLVFLLRLKNKEDKFHIFFNVALNLFCIIVTFSRGVYISLLLFLLLLSIISFRFFKIKQFIILNVLAVLILIISVIIVKDSFFSTVKFNDTISQKRSTEGRTTLWAHSLNQVKEKPIFGFGHNNYVFSKDNNPLVSEDVVFNNRTNNTYIQLLVERGYFGFLCYSLFFIIVIKIVWKTLKSRLTSNKEKIQVLIIISGLLAFLLREFTFSSFLEKDFVTILAFHLVFLLIPFDVELKQFSISNWQRKSIIYMGCTLFFIISVLNIKRILISIYNNKFISAYSNNNIKSGIENLEKALFLSPNNLTLLKHKALAFSKNALSIDISSANENLLVINVSNRDSLYVTKNSLLNVLQKRPKDHEILHNLGWIFMSENKYLEAENYFNKALSLNPFVVEYQCSLVLCKIVQSDQEGAILPLSNALQFSPDLIESSFYFELQKKDSLLTNKAKSNAILELKDKLKLNDNNPIYKARLAKLMLNEDSEAALNLLTSVQKSLPNLNRPWLYIGYLKSVENDTISANNYFKKALFLNKNDYLNFLFVGNFQKQIGNENSAIKNYEKLFEIYKSISSTTSYNNFFLSRIPTISNGLIPKELLYYIKPNLDNQMIFKYLEEYYSRKGDKENKAKYETLFAKYENQLFMGKLN